MDSGCALSGVSFKAVQFCPDSDDMQQRQAELSNAFETYSQYITLQQTNQLGELEDALENGNESVIFLIINAHGRPGDGAVKLGAGERCSECGSLVEPYLTGSDFLEKIPLSDYPNTLWCGLKEL